MLFFKEHRKKRPIGVCFFADEGAEGGGIGGGDGAGTLNGYYANNAGNSGAGTSSNNEFNFNEFKTSYAKEYLDKPYMKDIDSADKLFKAFDGAQSLIGKKSGIPGEGAGDQEWDDYFNAIRPKDTSVYKFDDTALPEELKSLRPEGFDVKVKDLFKDAAVTPKQAEILQKGYDKLLMDTHGESLKSIQEQKTAAAQLETDFNKLADKAWGKERESTEKVAKSLLKEFAPTEFKNHIENLSNENLIVLASVLKGVSDKYISQDDLRGLGSGTGRGDSSALRSEAQQLMAKLGAMSPFDPQYKPLNEQVNSLYSQIGKLMGDK